MRLFSVALLIKRGKTKANHSSVDVVLCSIFLCPVHTCAVQMLYWVNIASYNAIRPLCPAAAQARASKAGIA